MSLRQDLIDHLETALTQQGHFTPGECAVAGLHSWLTENLGRLVPEAEQGADMDIEFLLCSEFARLIADE